MVDFADVISEVYSKRMVQKAPFLKTRFLRPIYVTIVVGAMIPCAAQAQIWRCSSGYTNQPEGKSNCQPAGAIETCGSDGNRYLTPRKAGETPLGEKCKASQKGLNPFADMSQVKAAQFGDTRMVDRRAAPRQAKAAPAVKDDPKLPDLGFDMSDLFSCSGGGRDLQGCSVSDIRKFIEQTFNNMSAILNH